MPDQPSNSDATPEHDRRDAGTRAADLARLAEANDEATFGDEDGARTLVPGVLSGDVGPKGKVSSQLRGLSRRERATYGEVPRGTTSPGGFLMLLLPMLAVALVLLGIVVLLGWLVSR